jgi:hypothetical protein
MYKAFRVTAAMAAIGIAALSLTARAQAGHGSPVGAGLVGFGIGAILGSALAPQGVYIGPPPPYYYGLIVYGPPRPYDNYGYDDYGYGYGYDAYGPAAYKPPQGMRESYGYRTPAHRSPNAAVHEPRPGFTRSTTVKAGAATSAVEQESQAKFKAAQAKAKLGGVDTLTQKDTEGLSHEQIKQIRGY